MATDPEPAFSWSSFFIGTAVPITVFILKNLLDWNFALLWVKYCSWFPGRSYFRSNPLSLDGTWEQEWKLEDSLNFPDPKSRHSHPKISQWGDYCYAELIASKKTYILFGTVKNDYLSGTWHDKNDKGGYFGSFHLRIEDGSNLLGKWIGHSKEHQRINEGDWIWHKIQ